MKLKLFTAIMGLGLVSAFAMPSEAKTLTLQYHITAQFEDAFARALYYQDPANTDPLNATGCAPGAACYPDDWHPELGIASGRAPGDTVQSTLNISLFETAGAYSISALTSSGDLHLPQITPQSYDFGTSLSLRSFDAMIGNISFGLSFRFFSAGWDVTLAGGTGSMNYATEFGSAVPVTSCSPFATPNPTLPAGFCNAHDAEALFSVDSYQVTGLASVPLPASALLLAVGLGGLFAHRRLSTA